VSARTSRFVLHASELRNGHDDTGMNTSFSFGKAGSGGRTPTTVCSRSVISTVLPMMVESPPMRSRQKR
jgi:hypothetical protein